MKRSRGGGGEGSAKVFQVNKIPENGVFRILYWSISVHDTCTCTYVHTIILYVLYIVTLGDN